MHSSLARILCSSLSAMAVLLAALHAPAAEKERLPDPARVQQWVQMLPSTPRGVGRPITDRAAWEVVSRAPGYEGIVAAAEKYAKEPLPEASDELYMEFARNGNRTRYQKVLSQRRAPFTAFVLAECIENKGRFLPAIEKTILAMCAEKSWVLPAHDRGMRNIKGEEITIDLASSATSWDMATAYYWLGNKLSEETRALIRKELDRRTFTPFEGCVKKGEPWMWWVVGTNNWNAVCLANVTGAALAAIDSPERRAFFAASAEKCIEYFLSGFTADGYCSEGIGYWNYGFGHYVLLAETLYQATGGKVDLLKDKRIGPIARFGLRMEILPGVYPAFADCHVNSGPNPEMMAFLSRRLHWGLRKLEDGHLLLAGATPRSLSGLGVMGFPNSASATPPADASTASQPPRDWFEDAGILICRPASDAKHALGAAMKGGHNAEHHNHNDVGSFVVALGHDTPLLDAGSEVYTARTFSRERYKSGVLNSFGHPVPLVAGQRQKTGRDAQGKVLKTEFTDEADTLVLDLSSAYGVKELKELKRTFVFSRAGEGSLTVVDHVRFSSPQTFGTALTTFSPWKQSGDNTLVVGRGKEAVQVEIATDGQPVKIHEEKIQEDLPDGVIPIRLGIDFVAPVREATITLTIRPAEKGN